MAKDPKNYTHPKKGKQSPPEDPPDPPWPLDEAGCGLVPEDAGEIEGFEPAGLSENAGALGAWEGLWRTPCGASTRRHAKATTAMTGKAPMTNGSALSAYTLNQLILPCSIQNRSGSI